ncbi:hypothetical protein B296_00053520 [Ensete ventricosum]|uniref:Uncharacterized protein n=1 Tax=Ensete ventricosum TaxID=4639 RepID=A0A426XMC0_ENSVE|nr:hypothetical protein B296_00053520 [Ensete ventricosum]
MHETYGQRSVSCVRRGGNLIGRATACVSSSTWHAATCPIAMAVACSTRPGLSPSSFVASDHAAVLVCYSDETDTDSHQGSFSDPCSIRRRSVVWFPDMNNVVSIRLSVAMDRLPVIDHVMHDSR